MPKSTRHPKTQQINRVNQKAHYAMNRAGALENAYMSLSGVVIQHLKAIEEGKDAQEAVVDLALAWQQIDSLLRKAFVKIQEG